MTEETLFAAALEKTTPAEREAFLDEACSGDANLRRRVVALLESHEQADFMHSPAVHHAAEWLDGGSQAQTVATETPDEDPADVILRFLTPSDRADSLGRLGHYEILDVVGRGGMGIVLRGFDEKLLRVVAIKVMAVSLATSSAARRRFTREAQAAAAVCHDHIVTIHAVEEASGLPYLVMHFVAGMSLQERIERDKPLQLAEILRIGMQTASGLAAAHAQGLIHRDIKPANILLENGIERVKITDFGLARAADDASLTQSGVVAGTPQYMAPEQARGEPVDQRADLFSLGSVLYAMCTGRAPFRAPGTIAVMHRVCNEMPSPIRDSNPEVPDWLVAIIEKLHAKSPAERFQSAEEVARLLGQHLVNLQQPANPPHLPAVSEPRSEHSIPAPTPRGRWHWMTVVAALLCLLAGIGLAEATGVTHLASTVIRVLIPDGTLIVEANDPGVKVTVEGDGDLVISGAGTQEVRLRPGSYKVRATKDGKAVPLDRELVTITRGDKQIVNVRLEGAAVTTAAGVDGGAFVLLAAGQERRLSTLADALLKSTDGDTIEIRGNGPFEMKPIVIGEKALTIRAGSGFRPVLRFVAEKPDDHAISTSARLVLEGLELRDVVAVRQGGSLYGMIFAAGDNLQLSNCRLLQEGPQNDRLVLIISKSTIRLRNCEFYSLGSVVNGGNDFPFRIEMENCVGAGGFVSFLKYDFPREPITVSLRRNTLVEYSAIVTGFGAEPQPAEETTSRQVQITSAANAFDMRRTTFIAEFDQVPGGPAWESRGEVEKVLASHIDWREQSNVYSPTSRTIGWRQQVTGVTHPFEPADRDAWERLWRLKDTGSLDGKILLQGGDLLARLHSHGGEALSPDDFRLRPDSAGSRAGPEGKDLGADLDLVGPGPAYELWKKSPDYQQWLQETGQNDTAATAERGAFAVIWERGRQERRFDTLAQAVINSSDGDTIEVRGNGPFITEPITIQNIGLTIQAAAGYRPAIRLTEAAERANRTLLRTSAALRLEGMEFQHHSVEAPKDKEAWPSLIHADGNGLYVANCRFVSNTRAPHRLDFLTPESRVCLVRNCEFVGRAEVAIGATLAPCQRLEVENCVHLGAVLLSAECGGQPRKKGTAIRLAHNTVVAKERLAFFIAFNPPSDRLQEALAAGPIPVDALENIFDVGVQLQFNQGQKSLAPGEVKDLLLRVLSWRDRGNLLNSAHGATGGQGPETVSQWRDYWADSQALVFEGAARYSGGDLAAKLVSNPYGIKPADFRLRSDSAAHGQGHDGRDLGADVDFVGPGPAYERWKKTRDYQEWLKEIEPAAARVVAEPGVFVVMAGQGVQERKFDALAQALLNSTDGDTIEVRGNGPFFLDAIELQHALSMRAGAGFRPTFVINRGIETPAGGALITPFALRLEGLEFRASPELYRILYCKGPLRVANCRLQGAKICIECEYAADVRNCELLANFGAGLAFSCGSETTSKVANSLIAGHVNLEDVDVTRGAVIHFHGNTFVSIDTRVFFHALRMMDMPAEQIRNGSGARVHIVASENVFGIFNGAYCLCHHENFKPSFSGDDMQTWVPQRIHWEERQNLFRPSKSYLGCCIELPQSQVFEIDLSRGKDFKDWNQFWGMSETGSTEGVIRFRGGDLYSRALADVTRLTTEDFQLRADSAGYRTGPQGKDLGADVDLVGPGPGYERWKSTPEYPQWLREEQSAQSPVRDR